MEVSLAGLDQGCEDLPSTKFIVKVSISSASAYAAYRDDGLEAAARRPWTVAEPD